MTSKITRIQSTQRTTNATSVQIASSCPITIILPVSWGGEVLFNSANTSSRDLSFGGILSILAACEDGKYMKYNEHVPAHAQIAAITKTTTHVILMITGVINLRKLRSKNAARKSKNVRRSVRGVRRTRRGAGTADSGGIDATAEFNVPSMAETPPRLKGIASTSGSCEGDRICATSVLSRSFDAASAAARTSSCRLRSAATRCASACLANKSVFVSIPGTTNAA